MLRFWIWFVVTTGFIAAVAASLLAPISWSAYGRYVFLRYGWQMVAAILTVGAVLLVSLLAAGRRKASGLLALGMFISMVAHMMVASLFSEYRLSAPAAVTGNETKVAMSPGVPQLTESRLSEEVRGQFTATTQPDFRDLSVERKGKADAPESRIQRVEAKLADTPDREPTPERVQAVQASGGKARIEDTLATAGGRRPDVDKAVVVKLARVQSAREGGISQAAPRNLPDEGAVRVPAERMPAAKSVPAAPIAGGKERAPVRGATEIGGGRHGARKAEDILRAVPRKETVDALALSAAPVQLESTVEAQRGAVAERTTASIEVAHEGMTTPEASAPARVSRVLKNAPARAAAVRLSDAEPASENHRSRLDASASLTGGARPRAANQPVRIAGTFQPMTGKASSSPAPSTSTSGRKEFESGRIGKGLDLGVSPAAAVKATVPLQGRPVVEKTLAGALSGNGSAGASESPVIRDGLPGVEHRVDNSTVAAVGRRAEPVKNGAAPSGIAATFQKNYYSKTVTVDKRGMDQEGFDVGGGDLVGPSLAMVTAIRPDDVGVEVMSDVSVVQAVFAPVPADGVREPVVVRGHSAGLAMADVGGSAVPFTPVPSGGTGSTGTLRMATAGAWQDLGGGGRQVSGDWGLHGDAVSVPRRGMDEVFRSAGGPGSSLAGGMADVTAGGWTGAAAVPEDAAGSVLSRVAGSGAMHADIIAGAIRGTTPTEIENKDGGGDERGPGRGTVGMQFEKAETGMPQVEVGGAGGRLTVPAAARGTSANGTERGVSLADGEGVAVLRRGAGGSGTVPDGVLNVKSAGTVGGAVKVAFGSAVQEAARGEGGKGGGGVARESRMPGEILVAKVGGPMAADVVASRRDWLDVGSASLSMSGGKPHARMEGGSIGGVGQGGRSARASRGEPGGEAPRMLITDELSAVPKTVDQKAIYTLRSPERRKEMIRELGGSDKTERAVEAALVWLAEAQSDDGRWDVDGFKTLSRCGGAGDRSDEDVALTGLCLLSYLGAGYTHVKGEHKESVRKALNWLVDGQKADGNLQREGQMYGQAMATAALCESYSMTGDKRLLAPIEKAVGFIVRAQNPGAGWRYEPRKDSDTSVTGWQVLALKSAMIAGVRIAPEHFQWVEEWLDAVRRGDEGGLYAYMPGQGGTPTMTAEGWFCQLMMQEKTRLRGQNETIPYLMANLPAWSSQENGVNLYYWYYSTLALYMSGTPEFTAWNKALVNALLTGQVKRGAAQGSWDPVCVLGPRGGRIYMTATAALCLEVYYRYLPFYKQR